MLGEPRLGEVADLGCFTIWLFRTLFLSDPDSASSSAALVIAGRSGLEGVSGCLCLTFLLFRNSTVHQEGITIYFH